MAHTKGPWQAVKSFGTLGLMLIYSMNEEFIGEVSDSEANTRLIVAAPELLEACKALVGMCEGWIANPTERLEAAKAAIAKAEGK